MFGADDDDWTVYRNLAKKDVGSESEEDMRQISKIDGILDELQPERVLRYNMSCILIYQGEKGALHHFTSLYLPKTFRLV